uniref:Sushi domain-containing protein n=1 Tax=Macrostomum lignano TaxID=282301 RepID=A0A1I8JBY1_9PLAT
SAPATFHCSQATSVASWDGGPPVNQSYCVHSEERKVDDDYGFGYNEYTLFCEGGGGRPAQAESVEKRTKAVDIRQPNRLAKRLCSRRKTPAAGSDVRHRHDQLAPPVLLHPRNPVPIQL